MAGVSAQGLLVAACLTASLSLVTLVVYGIDKRAARKGKTRVAERTLHLLAAMGGWPGAYVGQRIFRHKTQKQSFRRLFWLTLAPAIAALVLTASLASR